MTPTEKEIRARESATAYVRGTESRDRTALIALLDQERAKSAAMLAALKAIALDADAMSWAEIRGMALDAIASAEGR